MNSAVTGACALMDVDAANKRAIAVRMRLLIIFS
jgi:hypothetical protein